MSSITKEVMLYVNSQNAVINSEGDYSFHLTRMPIENVRSIQLMSYNIGWSWFNVRNSTNTLVFKEGTASNITTTIPIGNYADTDIQDAIASAMTNASGLGITYTVSINEISMCFTIKASSGDFTILYPQTTMSSLIGLSATSTSVASSLTLGVFDLMPSKELQIRLPSLISNYETTENMNQDLIIVVSLSNYQYGDIIRENQASVECACLSRTIGNMTMSITDQTGYTPDFNESIPMSFSFRITQY